MSGVVSVEVDAIAVRVKDSAKSRSRGGVLECASGGDDSNQGPAMGVGMTR